MDLTKPLTFILEEFFCNELKLRLNSHKNTIMCIIKSRPKGDLWVQSPVIIIGNIRSIAENRRRSPAIMPKRIVGLCPLNWPSLMVRTAEGDLPKVVLSK